MASRVEEMVVTPLSYRLAELTPSESGNIVRMSVKKGRVVVSVVRPAEDAHAAAGTSIQTGGPGRAASCQREWASP